MNNRKRGSSFMNVVMAILMIAFGVGAGLFTMYDLFRSWQLVSAGLKVDAVVVDMVHGSQQNNGTASAPVFEYVVYDQTFHFTSRTESYPPKYHIGDHETLLVDPQNPNNAREDIFSELWLLPLILCPTSLVSIGAAILVWVVRRTRGGAPEVLA